MPPVERLEGRPVEVRFRCERCRRTLRFTMAYVLPRDDAPHLNRLEYIGPPWSGYRWPRRPNSVPHVPEEQLSNTFHTVRWRCRCGRDIRLTRGRVNTVAARAVDAGMTDIYV